MKPFIKRIFGVAAVTLLLLSSPRAGAADFHLYLDNVFSTSGVSAPASPGPWVDVLFHGASTGTVEVTISSVGLSTGEFLGKLYLNLNTNYVPSNLAFNPTAVIGDFLLPTISHAGANQYKADGDGYYDILFAFETANNTTSRFDGCDSVTYQITGIPNLAVSDFGYRSEQGGGCGAWFAAAHIQGIGTCSGTGSVWASPTDLSPVPEPTVGALLVLFASLWAGRRLKVG